MGKSSQLVLALKHQVVKYIQVIQVRCLHFTKQNVRNSFYFQISISYFVRPEEVKNFELNPFEKPLPFLVEIDKIP